MKKLIILLIAITIYSCDKEVKPSYVVFNGTIENSTANKARIFGNNFDKQLSISENGTFGDTLNIEKEGYYTLRIGRESTPIYMVQGSDFGVVLNAKEFDESLVYTGDAAAENNYLAAKFLLSEKEKPFAEVYKMSETDFHNELSKSNEAVIKLLNEAGQISDTFKNAEIKELEYSNIMNLENYPAYYVYLTSAKDFNVSESFFDSIKDFNYKDTLAYRNSNGYQNLMLAHYGRLSDEDSKENGQNKTVSFIKNVDNTLPDGFAKDNLMSQFLTYNLKADASLEEVYTLYKSANSNPDNLSKIAETYNLLKNLVPGKSSPSFAYENHNGGNTSLDDLKGKVVYVDVWATWCGPCKREIPFLKEVEADYHDKDIAFVSISIDVKKDYDNWRNMVNEKELGGIQLMADNDWKSKFVTDYGIRGIPRFILIDSKGNIINSDAPRPSNYELREVLDGLL